MLPTKIMLPTNFRGLPTACKNHADQNKKQQFYQLISNGFACEYNYVGVFV